MQVLTGTQDLRSGGTRRNVKKVTIHPQWDEDTFAYDIAVWELTADVPGITPALMIAAAQETSLASAGTPSIVTGWGLTSNNGNASASLREVSISIISRADCNKPTSYWGDVTLQMICAGAAGKDSCQGESGGPLWVKNAAGQFKLLGGIVSWGYRCASPKYPLGCMHASLSSACGPGR